MSISVINILIAKAGAIILDFQVHLTLVYG